MTKLIAAACLLITATPAFAQSANRSGAIAWNGPRPFHQLGGVCQPADRYCLGAASVVRQSTPSEGGPQALEGYTHVAHQTGRVQLAIGTIGNVELGGASGTVTDSARALQGGLVVTGPGYIERAVSLSLHQAKPKGDYTGAVNVKESIYIEFDNGWTIRPLGPDLLFCDPSGKCRRM